MHERGALLHGEADYQLHLIYLWYENAAERALELLRRPARPLSRQPALPCSAWPRSRTPTSTTSAPASATGGRCWTAPREHGRPRCSRKSQARLGAAGSSTRSRRPIARSRAASTVVAMPPARRIGARAPARCLRWRGARSAGKRATAAVDAYRRRASPRCRLAIRTMSREQGARPHCERARRERAEAYRLARSRLARLRTRRAAAAAAALTQASALRARRPRVIRVRHGRVQPGAERRHDAALADLRAGDRGAQACPRRSRRRRPISSGAALEARGNVAAARARYRSRRTSSAATRGLAARASRALARLDAPESRLQFFASVTDTLQIRRRRLRSSRAIMRSRDATDAATRCQRDRDRQDNDHHRRAIVAIPRCQVLTFRDTLCLTSFFLIHNLHLV